MDPLAAALGLGFVLGLQHAVDPDHLVAVATILSRERRFGAGARVGLLWGIGHTSTLVVAGTAIVGFRLRVGGELLRGLELGVAVMLVLLGALRLREAARGVSAVPRRHLVADHDHGHVGMVHSHWHEHGGHVHAHPHVHPSRPLVAALVAGRGRLPDRALLIGAAHGLAGSAAASLFVVATFSTAASAFLYLALLGLGTMAGMTTLTAAIACPVALANRHGALRRLVATCAGVGSMAFGLVYALRAL